MPDAGDERPGAGVLAPRGDEGWRGDDHALQVAAAEEVGLTRGEVALDLYRRGFARGLRARDPLDGALVLRGRTVLTGDQLLAAMKKIFRHLHLAADGLRVRVHDGVFEVRIAESVANNTSALVDAMRRALLAFVGGGIAGLLLYSTAASFALVAFSLGLLVGAWILRRGLADGRVAFAVRMVEELALLADREQLILPPAKDGGA